MKKQLTKEEEFDIMKLVLDKVLWLGFAIMAFGLYKSITDSISEGIWYLIAGLIVLVLFIVIIVREYEMIKSEQTVKQATVAKKTARPKKK